jgi:hypothetical protein
LGASRIVSGRSIVAGWYRAGEGWWRGGPGAAVGHVLPSIHEVHRLEAAAARVLRLLPVSCGSSTGVRPN